jgi:hypothetical protein
MAADYIDFWFTMGSTYSYLSVMRLADLQQSSGVQFRWRPFHLLIILQEMKHVPFADKPAKLAYMWRDIERRAAMYGIPASLPAPPMSAVLFESDGSSIAVSVDGSSRTLGKCPPGDISTLVNEALLNALATYYSKWEGLQPRWR